jgi:hypothetical protein
MEGRINVYFKVTKDHEKNLEPICFACAVKEALLNKAQIDMYSDDDPYHTCKICDKDIANTLRF